MNASATEHDVFITASGDRLALDPAHRAMTKPPGGYAGELDPDADERTVRDHLDRVEERIALGARLLALHGVDIDGKDVLLVGASDGAEAVSLLRRGARSVTGTDYNDHFTPDDDTARTSFVRTHTDMPDADVRFVRDDITRSSLADASFDVVVSWQTLEHVMDVDACMRETHRLLRPGGSVYHEYNPFFAIDGGHALVTLDTPWGHTQLDGDDIERYLRERRPSEADEAMSFFRTALNRRTQDQIRSAAAGASLAVRAWMPRFRAEDALRLSPAILECTREHHPGVTVMDMACRIVRCVLSRPA